MHDVGRREWPLRPHFMPRGFLKYCVLGMIAKKPMHGYAIMEELEQRTKGYWRPRPGSIYPALNWLEKKGYTRLVGGSATALDRGRHLYEITEEGRVVYSEYADRVADAPSALTEHMGCFMRLFWDFLKPASRVRCLLKGIKRGLEYLGKDVPLLDGDELERTCSGLLDIHRKLKDLEEEADRVRSVKPKHGERPRTG